MLILLNDSEEQVVNNYNLHMKVGELCCRLEQYDMLEFFKILRFSPTAPDIPLTYTMNILEHWEGVTERDVALHVEFLQHYG